MTGLGWADALGARRELREARRCRWRFPRLVDRALCAGFPAGLRHPLLTGGTLAYKQTSHMNVYIRSSVCQPDVYLYGSLGEICSDRSWVPSGKMPGAPSSALPRNKASFAVVYVAHSSRNGSAQLILTAGGRRWCRGGGSEGVPLFRLFKYDKPPPPPLPGPARLRLRRDAGQAAGGRRWRGAGAVCRLGSARRSTYSTAGYSVREATVAACGQRLLSYGPIRV